MGLFGKKKISDRVKGVSKKSNEQQEVGEVVTLWNHIVSDIQAHHDIAYLWFHKEEIQEIKDAVSEIDADIKKDLKDANNQAEYLQAHLQNIADPDNKPTQSLLKRRARDKRVLQLCEDLVIMLKKVTASPGWEKRVHNDIKEIVWLIQSTEIKTPDKKYSVETDHTTVLPIDYRKALKGHDILLPLLTHHHEDVKRLEKPVEYWIGIEGLVDASNWNEICKDAEQFKFYREFIQNDWVKICKTPITLNGNRAQLMNRKTYKTFMQWGSWSSPEPNCSRYVTTKTMYGTKAEVQQYFDPDLMKSAINTLAKYADSVIQLDDLMEAVHRMSRYKDRTEYIMALLPLAIDYHGSMKDLLKCENAIDAVRRPKQLGSPYFDLDGEAIKYLIGHVQGREIPPALFLERLPAITRSKEVYGGPAFIQAYRSVALLRPEVADDAINILNIASKIIKNTGTDPVAATIRIQGYLLSNHYTKGKYKKLSEDAIRSITEARMAA